MSTPRALTLAAQCDHEDAFEVACARELRRLHAENEDYGATIDYLTCENAEQIGEIVAIKEQRDELLAALALMLELHDASGMPNGATAKKARAAIEKTGGAV